MYILLLYFEKVVLSGFYKKVQGDTVTVGGFFWSRRAAKTEFWEGIFKGILPILQFSAELAAPKKLPMYATSASIRV